MFGAAKSCVFDRAHTSGMCTVISIHFVRTVILYYNINVLIYS